MLSFDLLSRTTRVRNRPCGFPTMHRHRLEAAALKHGPIIHRLLAIRLTQSMMTPEFHKAHNHTLVEGLIEATEEVLEPGGTSDYFELILSVEENRREVESAGLMGWMAKGVQMYSAPPLLAAAMLLHDDAWAVARNVYDLADWMNDMRLLEDEGDYLYAPESAACVVERFLDEMLVEF